MNKFAPKIPKELIDFNWAAFLLTFIWGYRYKAWVTFLAIPLLIIQMPLGLNWLLLAILQLYCGFKGNEWAYKQDFWKKPRDFRVTQMKWAAIALVIYTVIPLVCLTIGAKFFEKQDNLSSLIQNSQCIVANKDLQNDLRKLTISTNENSEALLRQIASIHNKKFEYGEVEVINSSRPNFAKKYKISANKEAYNVCTLSKQNCSLIYAYSMPNYTDYITYCQFYIDNNKRFKPDKDTKKALDMGLNIFKYLF